MTNACQTFERRTGFDLAPPIQATSTGVTDVVLAAPQKCACALLRLLLLLLAFHTMLLSFVIANITPFHHVERAVEILSRLVILTFVPSNRGKFSMNAREE